MMLKFKFLILICSFSVYSQTDLKQHLKVKYSLIYGVSEATTLKMSNKEHEDNEYYKQASKDMSEALLLSEKLISFELISDNQFTTFCRNQILYPEGVEGLKKIYLDNILNHDFFYSKVDNKLFRRIVFNDKKFLIDYSLNLIKWEILNETKIINKFLCHKAVFIDAKTYFKYTAWFAPEINFSVGPEFCYGLPGLVLEYTTGSFSMVCENIDFQLTKNEKEKLKIPDGEIISQADFEEIIRKARESYKN